MNSEIEFEEAMKYLEADINIQSEVIPKDYYNCLESNKLFFKGILVKSSLQKIGSKDSINEKKTKRYVNFLLKSLELTKKDKDFILKVDAAIKRGSLNTRIYKNLVNEIGTKQKIDEIVNAFRVSIDEVYLYERKNYDVIDSLQEKETIVLSEYLIGKD